MPHYFLDTSALAKLYRKEIGSDLVDRVVAEPDSRRFISRFTILEMESVLALKFRTGEIDEQSMLIARRRLEADLGSRRLLVATVSDDHLRGARQLLIDHGVMGHDIPERQITMEAVFKSRCFPLMGRGSKAARSSQGRDQRERRSEPLTARTALR